MYVFGAALFLISLLSSISLEMVGSQPLRHKSEHNRTRKKSIMPYGAYSQGVYPPYQSPVGHVSPVQRQKVIIQVKVLPVSGAKPAVKPTPPGTTTQVPGTASTAASTNAPAGATPSPAGGSQSPSTSLDAFRKEGLDTSNSKRAIHNAPPLQLDSSLNQAAQEYANKLAAAKTPSVHSNVKGQGENLANKCSTNGQLMTGAEAVTNWYNEVEQYDFANPGFSSATGHFTQVVWKASTKTGMGRAKYTDSKGWICYVIVARYTPPGNVAGQFPQNVVKGSYSG